MYGLVARPTLSGWGDAPNADVERAIPAILTLIAEQQSAGGTSVIRDAAGYVWQHLPPEAIYSRRGNDGWWYDLGDSHRLSIDEADRRKVFVVSSVINSHRGSDGWWYDNRTGDRLSYQDAWDRLVTFLGTRTGQAPTLSPPMPAPVPSTPRSTTTAPAPVAYVPPPVPEVTTMVPGTPQGSAPRSPAPTAPHGEVPTGPALAGGISVTTLAIAGAALLGALVLFRRRAT